MKRNFVMTEKQKQFAAEHHDLIYSYLHTKGLSVYDYYDIVVPGYLRAVVNYDEREDLRQYCFSTIAWKSMNTNLWNYHRYLNRKKRKADVISLDADLSTGNEFTLLDMLASNDNPAQDLDDKLLWLEVYSLIDEFQWELIHMRLIGYSKQDISRQLKIPFCEIDAALLSIWNSISRLFDSEISKTDQDLIMKGA